MNDPLRIELLQTAHCHLCEEALDVLFTVPALHGAQIVTVDIVHDAELFERFGEAIPVLRYNSFTLKWPFDASGVVRWMAKLG